MRPLTNIKKAPLEIAQLLANNKELVKLLVNDSPSALNEEITIPDVNSLISDQYINFYGPTEYGIQNFDRTAFISVFIDNGSYNHTDKNMNVSVIVYYCTKTDSILLDNNKNRLLEAVDRIFDSLDQQKVSAAGKLEGSSINYVFLDDFHIGYRMRFTLNDQQNRKVEF